MQRWTSTPSQSTLPALSAKQADQRAGALLQALGEATFPDGFKTAASLFSGSRPKLDQACGKGPIHGGLDMDHARGAVDRNIVGTNGPKARPERR